MNLTFRNNEGFTLLELLISIAIMVFISFAIYQATTQTFRLRDSLSAEGDFYNSIRISMFIVNRDVSLLYSPRISLPASKSQTSASTTPPTTQELQTFMAEDLNQTSLFWSAATVATGLRPSRFVGTETKMSFISTSHSRIYKDANESDFSKIIFEVKADQGKGSIPGTQTLFKIESPNAFLTNDTFRDQLVQTHELLRGIKKFKYTFYQRDGNTWKKTNTWDSDREETKYKYPDIVEISMEVVGETNLNFEGKFKFRPEIPLNGLDATN
jgi:general secretion pathway protein J